MVEDIELLRKMIDAGSILNLQQKNRQNSLVLQETNTAKGQQYRLQLLNVPEDCIAIKSDNFRVPAKFFQRDKGQTRRADYIVVAIHGSTSIIVFIELKKGKGDRSKIVQQLKGSQCLLEYCRSLGQNFWKENDFLDFQNYQRIFVSFRQIKLNKSRTNLRKQKNGGHDTPEKMITISGKNQLQFRKLLHYC